MHFLCAFIKDAQYELQTSLAMYVGTQFLKYGMRTRLKEKKNHWNYFYMQQKNKSQH